VARGPVAIPAEAEEENGLGARARRAEIVRLLDEQEYVDVAELSRRFGLTEASVRRDLALLHSEGAITRVRGGAVARRGARTTGYYAQAQHERLPEKRRIGEAAAALIEPRSVVFCDSGTTVARAIGAVGRGIRSTLTIVTNSLAVVEEVSEWDNPHVVSLGGLYLPEYAAFVGPQATAALQHLRGDVAVLGCDGVSAAGGLTIAHQLIAEVGTIMAQHARRIVAVADSTKVGRIGFAPFLPVSAVDTFITDRDADPSELEAIRAAGVEVITV
jgi:DeoR/GlpR family transcriptional regulator of sugar metabolism